MKKPLRILSGALLVLIILILVGLGVVYASSARRFSRVYETAPESLTIPTDSATVARGAHLVRAIGKCVNCHGDDLAGRVFIDGQPFGRFVAPNLTRGAGGISGWSDADLIRAIRHGVGTKGQPLVFMPALPFSSFGPSDLAAIIAYVKQVPPVDRQLPPTSAGPIARMLYLSGKLPLIDAEAIDHKASPPPDPVTGPTAEYGRYLAVTGGCTTCHGSDLAGGLEMGPQGTPPSANLTPAGIGSWTEADFMRALRTGRRPDGTGINPFMPWTLAREMTDDEIRAVYLYLQTLPAVKR